MRECDDFPVGGDHLEKKGTNLQARGHGELATSEARGARVCRLGLSVEKFDVTRFVKESCIFFDLKVSVPLTCQSGASQFLTKKTA